MAVVDERPPLTLTSDKSTECYRNWWPGPGDAMVALMSRSIDELENLAAESDNRFLLNRRGYLFATAREAGVDAFRESAAQASSLGWARFACMETGARRSTINPRRPMVFGACPMVAT